MSAPTPNPSPSIASSTFKEKPSPDQNEPPQQWTTRPSRPRVLSVLPGAIVFLLTIGFVVAILAFILDLQSREATGGKGMVAAFKAGYFYLLENPKQEPVPGEKTKLWVLTISNIANQFVAASSSVVIALVAYRMGAEWIRVSRSQSDTSAAETPDTTQYGLLVRLLGNAGPGSILEALKYTVTSWRRTQFPRIFQLSLWLVSLVWILARLVGLADLWLHTASFSGPDTIQYPVDKSDPELMGGIAFNETICNTTIARHQDQIAQYLPDYGCKIAYEYFVINEGWGSEIDYDVMVNSSVAPFQVGLEGAGEDMTFVLPLSIDKSSYDFTFATFAAQATCTSLNHQCSIGTDFINNCSTAGYPGLPYFAEHAGGDPSFGRIVNRVLANLDGELIGKESGSWEASHYPAAFPAKLAIQMQWEWMEKGAKANTAALSNSQETTISNTNSAVYGTYSNWPTMYAACDLAFFNATVHWHNREKRWEIVNATETSLDVSSAFWIPVVGQYATELLGADLMYAARSNSASETMVALSQTLARLSLGAAAGFYTRAPATNVTKVETVYLATYPVGPILAVIVTLLAYAVLTLGVFVSSCLAPDEAIVATSPDDGSRSEDMKSTTLTLTQRYLTGQQEPHSHTSQLTEDRNDGQTRLAVGMDGARFGVIPWNQRQQPPVQEA